ncbi:MAG: RdgB/HAM1 family non-canonical purine NTP pyrophosphatase [Anaerolineales bacterium]
MRTLLIASSNPGKLKELQALLANLELDLLIPSQIGLHFEVKELGETYAENAGLKAIAYARASGLLTLADDSGLEVDVLDGAPGLHSARFSPKPGATDADRRTYLLEQLSSFSPPWRAHFHCTVALAEPVGNMRFAQGDCFGVIIPEERGSHGFGYDPIFLISELGKTMAELDMEEKNRISHRARAVKSAIPMLTEM